MTMTDPFALKALADTARDEGKLDEAIQLYDQAIALRPQFAAAYYEKGDVLSRKGLFTEAANCFMVAWVHGRFRKEPGLMCGRALVMAKLTLEACRVFEKIPPQELDTLSALFYADALRREFRIRDAVALFPMIERHRGEARWRRIVGHCYLEMNNLGIAAPILEAGLNDEDGGFILDKLTALYYSLGRYDDLRNILNIAVSEVPDSSYFSAQLAVLDVIEGRTPQLSLGSGNDREDLLDAALYLKPHLSTLRAITGTTYQTFDELLPLIPSEGLVLEFGVRNGHTIHHIADILPERKVYGFDSFEGLPEAWHDEGAGSYSAGGRLPKVPANVEFVVGWFNETLPDFKHAHPEPIAFMNVDCDLYSATKTIFDELDAQIVPGTIIVFDEYIGNKTWRLDEFKAFQEWVQSKGVEYEYLTASFYTKQVSVRILRRKGV